MNALTTNGQGSATLSADEAATVREGLAQVCDRLTELSATVEDMAERGLPPDVPGLRSHIDAINLLLWRMRWQVGPAAGDVTLVDEAGEPAEGGPES